MNKKEEDRTTETKENDFFPEELRGKKLKDAEWLSVECKELLEKYLTTEDSEFLIRAINLDNRILQGVEGLSVTTEFVDAHTIAWRTINWWQELFYFTHNESDICVKSKKLLTDIGKVFVPNKVGWGEIDNGDFIIHKRMFGQGGRYRYSYKDPFAFVRAFEIAQDEFEKTKCINKLDGYKEAINNIKHKFSNDPLLKHFKITIAGYDAEDLEDMHIGLVVARFFKTIHVNNCVYCDNNKDPEKDLTPEHVQSLYREAKDEIYLTSLMVSGKATLDDLNRLKDRWKRSKKGSNLKFKIDEAINTLNKNI